MRLHRSLALAMLGAAACTPPAPPPPVSAPPAALPSPAPTAPPAASAVAEAPPPAPVASAKPASAPRVLGCVPRGAVNVAPFLRRLFEKGRRTVYTARDDVDPHDVDGKRIVSRSQVECVVESVVRFKHAVASEMACTSGKEENVLPLGDRAFVATEKSLWMTMSLPTDEAAVEGVLKEPPLFAATPVNEHRKRQEPAMFEGMVGTCDDVVEVGAPLVCSDVSCSGVGPYGPTQDRRCFSAARGFESWRHVNLAGPRTTTWSLAAVKPPGPPPAESGSAGVPPCAD